MKKLFILLLVVCLVPLCSCKSENLQNSTYNIHAEYTDNGVIGAHMSLNYVCNIDKGTDIIKFNIFPNAFRKDANFSPISDEIETYGGIDILSVKNQEKPLEYEICGQDKNILKVSLGKLISYGEKITVDIDFALLFPCGDYRFCKGVNTVNVGNWFPILCAFDGEDFYECEYYKYGDPFYSCVADYNVELLVPSDMVVASSSKAVSCDVSGDKTLYSYSISSVRDFAFCMSKKFNVLSQKLANTTVNYYYYADNEPEKSLQVAVSSLEYFSKTFGEYPYDEYSVCQSNFAEGGMEYPGIVYINDTLNLSNRLYTIVHETAHQWWYGIVGNNQLVESYLDEGLTEYSTAIFFDENEHFNISSEVIFSSAKKSAQTFGDILQALGKTTDYKMVKSLKDYNSNLEYVNTAYNRPLTMMKTLEEEITRDRVKQCLKVYFDKNKYQIATTSKFLSVFSKGKPILQSFIDGKVIA